MNIKKGKIGNALESVAPNHVVAEASAIYDQDKEKYQGQINAEVDAQIFDADDPSTNTLIKRVQDVEALGQISVGPVESQIATGTDFDDPTAEQRAKVPTVGAILDGFDPDGAYDVTARNAGSPTFESLDALLNDENLATLIPEAKRHGGMSIKFVQSSDHKYVQYRLMKNTFSTTESDWQGVDDKPVAGSPNLVQSGGVFNALQKLSIDSGTALNLEYGVGSSVNPKVTNANFNSVDIPVSEGDVFEICGLGGTSYKLWGTLDEDRRIVRITDVSDARTNHVTLTIGKGEKYLICNFNVLNSNPGWAARKNNADSIESSSNETNKLTFKKETKSAVVAANATISLRTQYIRRNCVLSCVANGTTPYITLGRGTKTTAYAYWAEIGSENIVIKAYKQDSVVTIATIAHGLTLAGYLNASIVSNDTTAKILLESQSGVFKSNDFEWCGGGAPFVENNSSATLDCSISFYAEGMNDGVLLVQDSYGIYWNRNTAAYHLLNDDINGWQINCQTGIASADMYYSFVASLHYGKPQFAVWCVGMNDGADTDSETPNSTWLTNVSLFINVCKSLRIIPVLGTIPSVPSKLHDGKNYWIKNVSGCRYVDFAKAVGAQANGTWYADMLSADNVHPTLLGGRALMTRLVSDLPEIINGQHVTKNDIENAKAEVKGIINNYSNVINASNLSKTYFAGIVAAATYIKDNYPELKKKGALMTFYNGSRWMIYQFKDTDNTIIDTAWINPNLWELITRDTNVFVPASAGINGINNVLWNNPNGCIIELEEGTYTGTEGLSMTNGGSAICSNCLIIGKGVNTIISRNVGYNDLIANVGSNNVISNCNFAHSITKKPGAVVLYQCIVNGVYTDDSVKSAYDLKIASPTSTEQAKMNADIICSASAAQSAINSAINSLSNGGTIILAAGTYTIDSYIDLRGKTNIAIIGSGPNTIIDRTGGGYCFMDSSTTNNCCIKNLKHGAVSLNYTQRIDIWEGNDYKESEPNSLNIIKVLPTQGIAGINNAIYSLKDTGGTIVLSAGTYSGDDPVNFYKASSPSGYISNVRIIGQGESTIISRNVGYNDMTANNGAIANCIFDGVKFAHSIQRSGGNNPVKMVRLVNCYIGNVYVDESAESSLNVINVGEGRFYTKLSTVLDLFFQSGVPIGKDNRWEIHLYGHIIENTMVSVGKNYIDLIGHNCVLEIQGGKNQYFQFIDQATSYYGPGLDIVVKDIHFLKTGCYAYWDSPCVNCLSSWVTFENCIFENATSNPMPFNQADYTVGYEDDNGGRRHGIEVYCYKYGTECKTKFVNCVAIGSPYGTNSSRGFYLVIGQPKLFNCIGYGGGYGEFGHGIINHRASRAELFSCIGYAGEHSYRQAAGIRFQACGSSQLNGCIGYPSYGTKLISNGVKATAVERICTELGLTVTDYVSGGVVDFNAVKANTSLCAKINNDDIDLLEVGASTEESYGFSFWANSGVARLLDCKGYIGSGENSKALHCIAKSEPTIIGGYFGLEDIMTNTYFKADTGQNYMTFRPQNNIYSPIKCRKVAASITFAPANGDKLYIRTDESTPQYLVNGYDMTGLSSIVNPIFESIVIPAGVSLVVYIKNGDTMKQITEDSMLIHFCYNYIANSTTALYIADEAKPIIKGSVLRNHATKDAISVGSGVSNIKVFDCLCEGTVDSEITFASKTAINGSSNYSI